MKLKTLKDIGKEWLIWQDVVGVEEGMETSRFIDTSLYDAIRKLAVDWVKEENIKYPNVVPKMFIDFFNITEEDLK